MDKTQPFEKSAKPRKIHQIITNNFIGGIAWALGVTIGFSLLIAILGILSHYLNLIPYIGRFVSDIIDFVLSYNKNIY